MSSSDDNGDTYPWVSAEEEYLNKIASKLIENKSTEDDDIVEMLEMCDKATITTEDINVEDIRERIDALKRKGESNKKIYRQLYGTMMGSMLHEDKIISMAAEMSKLTNEPRLLKLCNDMAKTCQDMKISLEGAKGALQDFVENNDIDIPNIQFVEEATSDYVANIWAKNKERYHNQPGILDDEGKKDDDKKGDDGEEKKDDGVEKKNEDEDSGEHEDEKYDPSGSDEELPKPKKKGGNTRSNRKNKTRNGSDSKEDEEDEQNEYFNLDEEGKKYAALSKRFADSDGGIIAADTSVLQLVLLQTSSAFSGDIDVGKVSSITNSLITILEPLSKTKVLCARKHEVQASNMKSTTVRIGPRSTWGSIASSCEASQSNGQNLLALPDDIETFLDQVETAIGKVSNLDMDKFVDCNLRTTTNILSNSINLSIGIVFCSLTTVGDVYCGLKNKSKSNELLKSAADLAFGIQPDAVKEMILLEYINTYLRPSLADDMRKRCALVVTFELKHYMTQTGGATRNAALVPKYKIASCTKATEGDKDDGGNDAGDGDEVDYNNGANDYCGGDEERHKSRRRRITNTVWVAVLQDIILERVQAATLFPQPFIYHILCSSQTTVFDKFNLTLDDLSCTHEDKIKLVKKIESYILGSYKGKDSVKKPVIITGQNQINALLKLLP